MGHSLEQLGTAALDTLGGLITFAAPQDLPEGASPRCWDVDYIVGSVFTRAGLQNVYAYSNTLIISAVVIYSGIGTFTFAGRTPTINEQFTLSGFNGTTLFLNGQVVFVLSVGAGTFTALLPFGPGIFTGLSGIATSNTGNFLGPNVPTVATSVVLSGGNAWQNPDNVMGDTAYASVTSGASSSTTQTPPDGSSLSFNGAQIPWNSVADIVSNSAFANVTLASTQSCAFGLANGTTYSIPADATVTGVVVSFKALCSVFGVGSINVQLINNTTKVLIGTPVNVPVSTSANTYTKGSSSYQWGTVLTPAAVNGSEFGVVVSGQVSSGTATLSLNSIVVTVYYALAGSTQELQTTGYVFSVPATSGVSGIGASFQAYSSAATELVFQLLKNGVAVGNTKTQPLTTVPTVYTLGDSNDQWGTTFDAADINSIQFGIQVTAAGAGVSFINDMDLLAFITPALVNFNYVKSYIQDNQQTYTLALDASGLMWSENVTSDPGILTLALSGILPGSFARSATADNNEYICFSDLSIGTERPRVANTNPTTGQLQFLPLSQVGPAAPPACQASVGNGADVLQITAYSITSDVVTFTFTATQAGFTPVVGSLYVVQGTGNSALDGKIFTVLGSPAPSTTQFSAAVTAPNASASGLTAATAAPTYNYAIQSITQPAAKAFNGQMLLWSAGPTSTTPGTTITFYYGSAGAAEDPDILNAFNAGNPCIVYITGVPSGAPGDGTWLLTGHGVGIPPSETGEVPYFTIQFTSSNYQRYGGPGGSGPNGPGNDGNYQITLATLTTATPIPDLAAGDNIQINGATPAGWNGSWIVQTSLNSAILNITSTQMSATGVATYGYNVQSGVFPPVGATQVIVTTSQLTNAAIFNTTGVVQVSTITGSTFQISGFPAGFPIAEAAETGQAVTFGTEFTFDPGTNDVGTTTTNPIFGNDTGTGFIAVVGGSITPIGAGTRQAVVFFITETGYYTAVSPATTFTTSQDANFTLVTNIPLGPPNVIARGIAFTEAGANGVPGANFYFIPQPVVITVGQTTTTYTSTLINDNVSTSAKFTFTDQVLLNEEEIDIQGADLFNLIELGSSAWCVPYAGRMFYGLQLNKVTQFSNLTFDGGYLPTTGGGLQPLGNPQGSAGVTGTGWTIVNPAQQELLASPVTGQALYIPSQTAHVPTHFGMIYQTAYQDQFQVPIILPNTLYSVRVAVDNPDGIGVGTLVVDLTDYHTGIGFGQTYGSFSVPLSSMSTNMQVFTGTLLTKQFTVGVSPALQLRVYVQNSGNTSGDALIDRIEVFPTATPYLGAQVYGSYVNDLEAIDASNSGGIIDTTPENTQFCYGGFVMHDNLFLLKQSSMYSTENNPNSEPGGWSLREVSNKVGACGINAYDVGEEWAIMACRAGVFGFSGGQPVKLSLEIFNLWDMINWEAGNTIVLRNDINNKRFYCWIPLPTGTSPTGVPTSTVQWLPNAVYNPNPTTPNVCLMCNYQGLDTAQELFNGPGVHTTMFGSLAAVDMKRKWSIWQIPSPYSDFIYRQDSVDNPLFVCNGIMSSKIYQFESAQYSDDGVAINSLYTTYGHVNAVKAATQPIFGMHTKRYTVLQGTVEGAGTLGVRILPNVINPKYPYSVPVGVKLVSPAYDDFFRSINAKAQRAFLEFSTNAVGSWFHLDKTLLTGKADPWSSLNPTGGMNNGIAS